MNMCNGSEIDGENNKLSNICANNQCTIDNSTDNSINNNTNITNIYLNIKHPIPFDDDWDISQINVEKQTNLLFSKVMFTGLLEEILKNDINLNVIIDKENDSGMVYKNDIDKYIQMKLKDIADNSMDKLKKHLVAINKSDMVSLDECLMPSRHTIERKYNDYKSKLPLQNAVNGLIAKIYETKKEEAINISETVDVSIKEKIKNGY